MFIPFVLLKGPSHEMEIPELIRNNLIPTASSEDFIKMWAEQIKQDVIKEENQRLQVSHIFVFLYSTYHIVL